MNGPRNSGDEDLFASLLASVEKQLAAEGSTEDEGGETAANPDGNLNNRLMKARRCLELIDRVRQADPDTLAAEHTGPTELGDSPNEPLSIGRFQIIRELGRGGHGVVYLALDPELEREVALKVPRPEVVVSGGLDRFVREAKVVASLSHAHIVPVYEVGNVGPIWFIASAYCKGVSLAEWLMQRRVPAPPQQAAELVMVLAEAMQHAHGRGVVHRDLKPSNVLLEVASSSSSGDSEASPKPLITDFGLAKLLKADSAATQSGAVLGTPAYMAPEQATGSGDVGPAADIYALGAILYEVLTGQPPFGGETIVATLRAVESDEPVPPSRLRRDVPRDLESICLKCLDKNSELRYESGTALAADLNRYLRSEPVVARRISSAERLLRWTRRNPVVAGLSTSVAVALIVGSAISIYFALAERSALADTRAALQAKTAALADTRRKIDHYVATVQDEELLEDARFQPLRKKLLGDALAYYQQLVREHRHEPTSQRELAQALFRVGEITYESGTRAEALVAFREAALIYATLLEANPSTLDLQRYLARSDHWMGSILSQNGEPTEAESMHQQAIDIQERVVRQHPEQVACRNELASTRSHLGKLYRDTERPDRALAELQESVRIQRGVVEQQPDEPAYRRELAVNYGTIGMVHHSQGKIADAMAASQQAADLFESLTQDYPQVPRYQDDLANNFIHLGVAYARMGKIAEALEAFENSMAAYQRLATEHPTVTRYQLSLANSYMSLGNLYGQSRRTKDAMDTFRVARPLIGRLFREDPENIGLKLMFATVHQGYASVLSDTGAGEEALPEIEVAITTLEEILENIPQHGTARYHVGISHAVRGRTLEKLDRHAESLASWRRACEFAGPRTGTVARVGLGRSLARNGQHQQAIDEAHRLVESDPDNASTLYDAAEIVALAAGAVGQDRELNQDDRDAKFEVHVARAIELLRQAHAAGRFPDAQAIEDAYEDPDLAPLRQHESFKRFIDSLKAAPVEQAPRASCASDQSAATR